MPAQEHASAEGGAAGLEARLLAVKRKCTGLERELGKERAARAQAQEEVGRRGGQGRRSI